MRALGCLLLSACLLSTGCAHLNSEKVLEVAGEIKSAGERLANFQLALAGALAEQGERAHCVEIAKVALWTLSSLPHKLSTIAAELGLDIPQPVPVAMAAESYCDARLPKLEPEPQIPAQPSTWVFR